MSNKKRIQKKTSELELMRLGKLAVSMSNIISFVKEWKERQKSLKLVSGAVEPKGLITEEGYEMMIGRNIKITPIDENLTKESIVLIELQKTINKDIIDLMKVDSRINLTRVDNFPKQRVGFLGLEKQKDGSVKTVFAGSEDYKEKLP